MASPKKYHVTMKSVFQWAIHELNHVGRIASVEDPDIQYSYALSTLNGMAHLKDAIYELLQETHDKDKRRDIQLLHDQVVRVMLHLKKSYKINLEPIRQFNVRGVLSNLKYLSGTTRGSKKGRSGKARGTRKNK